MILKKIFKITFFAFLCTGFSLYADDNIELPDLTTVVTTDNDSEENIPAPDFTELIQMPETLGKLVPELPEVELQEGEELAVYDDNDKKNQIYAEGKIGGGYPASFTGDFAVSKIYGENPFRISFNHQSSAGYCGHLLSEGYSNNTTEIKLNKSISLKNLFITLDGSYQDLGNGLQSKAESISSINQDTVFGKGNLLWNLPKGFFISSYADSEFYNRFSAFTYNSSEEFTCPDWVKNSMFFSVGTGLNVGWKGNGIETAFDAAYSFTDTKVNRGSVGADFSWKNDYIKLFTDFAFVFSTSLNDNNFVVPFTAGINASFPVYFSDRKVSLALQGGLKSEQKKISDYERKYKFTGFSFIPAEQSDWYSSFRVTLPLKSAFAADLGVDYSISAFGNNKLIPSYDSAALINGIYGYAFKEQEALSTFFDFTYRYKIFAITVKWWSNWIDLPVLENKHNFILNMSLQGKEGNWGTSVEAYYSIDAADKTPLLNFEAFMQVSSATKIVLSANDIIKLVSAESRTYAGQYVANSGNVTLLIKFLF